MATTLIRNASFIVAWDAGTKSHTYMPDADIAYEDGVIVRSNRSGIGCLTSACSRRPGGDGSTRARRRRLR